MLSSLYNARGYLPLDAGKHSGNIVCRTPPVLQDVQTQFPRRIYVRMEHLANELDQRGFVGVLLLELHDESEGAVLERRVGRAYNDGVPMSYISIPFPYTPPVPLRGDIPLHNIVGDRRRRYTSWGVCLHTLGAGEAS